MKPKDWKQIEELYHSALPSSPAARSAFLDQACGGNNTLRKEVETLLSAQDQSGDFMEESALALGMKALAEEEAPLLIGQTIGSYEILKTLGRGGMGDVYLAHDPRLERKVALKLLPSFLTRDAERIRRFQQEARAASKIAHPHVAHIYEVGQDGDEHFIAMEFVDGVTLRHRLKEGPLAVAEAIEIAVQIASALTAAHHEGVVHRDIKPDNVMLRPDGYIAMLDFGLAKLSPPSSISGLLQSSNDVTTEPGFVMGSAMYMSPEQARGQEVDARTDIWSLGVVLYEMLAGENPFRATTTVDVMAAVLRKDLIPLARLAPAIPAELDRIVTKMLQRALEQRYGTVLEVLNDLRRFRWRSEPIVTTADATEFLVLPPASEAVSGAIPLDSQFYIMRGVDDDFDSAVERQDSIVLIKGARQMGKTSLLARGLQKARAMGAYVVITDFQTLNEAQLTSAETLLLSLAQLVADKLEIDLQPDQVWSARHGPSVNFENYMKRTVLGELSGHLVWGLDEVDRLFTCDYGSEVFGLFRSWHNARALEPAGPWQRLTMAISYATEAHLFISDLNQSPFNVGTRLLLEDFDREQVAELNRRYGSPLKVEEERERFYQLLGGHPFLTRQGLKTLATGGAELDAFIEQVEKDEGPFGNHLRRILLLLLQDATLLEAMKEVLKGASCPTPESFYRLRSAGLLTGESIQEARLRCRLYADYFKRRLG